jgi:ribosomal protein L29
MKSITAKELHQKTVAELGTELIKAIKELTQARLEKAAGRLKNVSSVARLADHVARVRVTLGEKNV